MRKLNRLKKKRLKLSSQQLKYIHLYGSVESEAKKQHCLKQLRRLRDEISTLDQEAIKVKGMIND